MHDLNYTNGIIPMQEVILELISPLALFSVI